MKKIITGCTVAGILIIAVAVLLFWFGKKEKPMLTVNGNPVYEEEYLLLLKEHRVQYESALRNEQNVPSDQNLTEFLGQKEYEKQMRRYHDATMTALRVRQELAYQYGVLEEPFSYAELLKKMEQENADRAEKLANGEPVYGLQQFDITTYYSHFMSNLEQQTIRSFSEKSPAITDQEVDAYYQNLDTMRMTEGETMDYTVYDLTELQHLPQEQRAASEQQAATELAEGTDQALLFGKITLSPKQVHWTPDELREIIRTDESAERVLLGTEQGAVCGTVLYKNTRLLLRYDGFTKATTLTDAERGSLRHEMYEKAYLDLVQATIRNAKVTP